MLTVLAKQNTNKTKKPHTFGLSTNTDTDTITASVTVATIELFVIFLLHLVYYLCRSKKKKKGKRREEHPSRQVARNGESCIKLSSKSGKQCCIPVSVLRGVLRGAHSRYLDQNGF